MDKNTRRMFGSSMFQGCVHGLNRRARVLWIDTVKAMVVWGIFLNGVESVHSLKANKLIEWMD